MKIMFVPLEDITTYELAWIYARVSLAANAPRFGISITKEQADAMPENIKRHFQIMVEQ